MSDASQNKRWIPHSASFVGEAEMQAVNEVLRRNHVGHGPKAAELEAQICKQSRRQHAFGVSSGHHALALAIRALDLPRPSLIAIPVLTCASVLAAVTEAGHHVWLTDINENDLTFDPQKISRKATAVIAAHAYGAPVDADAVRRLGLPWIEDCATSPTAFVAGKPAGAHGTFAIFSFGSTKYLTGGAGGMALTDDVELAARVKDQLDLDAFEKKGAWKNGIPNSLPGKLSDLNAAMVLAQWNRLPEILSRRRSIAQAYQSGLQNVSGLRLPGFRPEHGYYRYIIRTEKPANVLIEQLHKAGIDARTSINPWLDRLAESDRSVFGGPWPVAEQWKNHLLSLPIHPGISDADVNYIVEMTIRISKKA